MRWLKAWLVVHGCVLVRPDDRHPYYSVRQLPAHPHGASRFVAAAKTPALAVAKAIVALKCPCKDHHAAK